MHTAIDPIQIAILGPLEARRGAEILPVTGTRLRRLLLRLAVDAGRRVSPSALVEAVWGETPPAEVTNALQSLVSRLRRALGDPAVVRQVPGGYRLDVEPEHVDAHRFLALAASGRRHLNAADPGRAAGELAEALALWRGDPLSDADDAPYAVAEASRWDQLRLDAVADRVDADLALGHPADVVVELVSLTDAYPLRERFAGQLMRALGAAGRTAEALAAYERMRTYLADELGTDPSPALQQQHLDLLRGSAPDAGPDTAPGPSTSSRTSAGLLDDAAPSARRQRINLRSELSSFVGRDDEVKRLDELVGAGRLTTIVGPGGAGKTRLATRVAQTWLGTMPDGVWFVELAPVSDAVDIAPTILGSLGVRENALLERRPERRARDATERLLESLADATCLLVVDNCEHLVSDVAEVVDTLLARCPGLRVLATTREPLGIAGESLCVLRPLALPDVGVSADQAVAHESVRLFADRACAVRAEFEVDDESVADVIEIVRRLDGLPLAIELAAARLRVLPVHEVAARLSDRFALLTGGSRTALPRHRTLHAVVRWSWDLLTAEERLLAERLAVFSSGITPASTAAVCADTSLPRQALPGLLDALVDKSLLQLADGSGLRYRMLETIREFGLEQLASRGEVHGVRRAHADHFAAVAAEADQHLRSRDQLVWLERLDVDRDNILAALKFLADSGDAVGAIDLALSLAWYWNLLGSHGEAATWLGLALAVPGRCPGNRRLLAEALQLVNSLAGSQADGSDRDLDAMVTAMTALDERLAGVDLGDTPTALVLRPILALFSDRPGLIDLRVQEALTSSDPWVRATVLAMRASQAENHGDLDRLRQDSTDALAGFTEIGDRWGLATTLSSVAMVRTLDGDLPGALAAYEQATMLLDEIGSTNDVGLLLLRRSVVLVRLGRLDEARQMIDRVAANLPRSSSASLLVMIGRAAIARGSGDTAALAALTDDLHELADSFAGQTIGGHGRALALTILAEVSMDDHDLPAAAQDLAAAYQAAVNTRDMPIVAAVGVAVARLAVELGDPSTGAAILGAAAQVRGADDPTDPAISSTRRRLAADAGTSADARYAEGRALPRPQALQRLDPRLLAV